MMKYFLFCVMIGSAVALAPLFKVEEPINGRYIVKMKDGADLHGVLDKVRLHEAFDNRVKVRHTYEKHFNGFAAALTDSLVDMIRSLDAVAYVEQDGVVRAAEVASWGLDRVDQKALPLNNEYNPMGDGSGVSVYVLDTGINPTHVDFENRAAAVYDPINDGQNGIDCHGHGTHCAGTVAGLTYGVAYAANVYGIRVLSCSGSGSSSDIIAGDEWVADNGNRPCVASMSLGGGASQASDDGVRTMINAGVQVAVAAGNDDNFACATSPARTYEAVTVGATDNTDTRAYFSNYGACVDIWAPGVGITSAWYDSDTSSVTISGTSMACPHVAGGLALLLQDDSSQTPEELKAAIQTKAIPDVVIDPMEFSPNLLLFTATGTGGGAVPDAFPANIDCGTVVTDDGAIITPPNYPYYTGNNLECGYRISAPAGRTVTATFNYFAVEPKTISGCWDVLNAYDGADATATLLTSICGQGTPGPITSSGTNLYIELVTDTSVGYPGFEIKVSFN